MSIYGGHSNLVISRCVHLLDVKSLCELYKVSRSGYYRWRSSIAIKKPDLSFLVLNSFLESEKAYGTRRIREDLRKEGAHVSKATISSIMKGLHISSSHHKLKFRKKNSSSPKVDLKNILNRDFVPGRKDKFWASDTTYIKSRRGWVYLCAVIDLGFKEVIGWDISNRNDSHLVCSSLNSALFKRAYPRDVIFHSDQGSEFQSQEVSSLLK